LKEAVPIFEVALRDGKTATDMAEAILNNVPEEQVAAILANDPRETAALFSLAADAGSVLKTPYGKTFLLDTYKEMRRMASEAAAAGPGETDDGAES